MEQGMINFGGKLTHRELVNSAYKWIMKNGGVGVAFKELNTNASNGEYPDVIGFGTFGYSVLIECKASRNDFRSDKNKSFRKDPQTGMGTVRYYCAPKGMLKKEDLPYGWGLIHVDERGKATCHIKPLQDTPTGGKRFIHHEKNLLAEHGLMYSALRRLQIRGHIETIYERIDIP